MSLIEQFKPTGEHTVETRIGDQYAETPFFAPGLEEDTEFKSAWPKGVTVAGTFVCKRTKKDPGPKSTKNYGVFQAANGDFFRLDAPGQLNSEMDRNMKPGTYVEITYEGKQFVKALEADCHSFVFGYDKKNLN